MMKPFCFGRDDSFWGDAEESGQAELDTLPFAKYAKGRAPRVVVGLFETVGAGVHAVGEEDTLGWGDLRCAVDRAAASDDVQYLGGVAGEGDGVGGIAIDDFG